MFFEGEDAKTTVDSFKGLYNRRGVPDEVPPDHARDVLNVVYPSQGGFATRSGVSKALNMPQAGIRRFFAINQAPTNLNQPLTYNANAPDGGGMLFVDGSGNIYVGNNPIPIYHSGAINDFTAVNVGNRTYISPYNNFGGVQGGRLQVYDARKNTCRDAAGLAPAQSYDPITPMLSAASGPAAGNVPAGLHKILVIYETDTGFWTQPGPKRQIPCTPAASVTANDPTVFTVTDSHGMFTGESHTIRNLPNTGPGITSLWANCNGTYFVTVIDDTHFSIPVNTFGYVSPPTGQIDAGILPATVTADGTHSIHLTNIPTGPSFVKKRIILATRANENEYFFVPDVAYDGTTTPPTIGSYSVINDNITTATYINFNDTDLVASADYLFDILEFIPGGSALCKYRGRLAIAGVFTMDGVEDRIILSNIDDPETFNWVSGYIQVQTESDGNTAAGLFVLRDTFYITKFAGVFAAEDNGNEPSTWKMTTIDSMVGAYSTGISTWTVGQPSSADTGDIAVLASKIGLFLFDGVMRRPELSWKIQGLWRRINWQAFYRVQVAHDPWAHLIYIIAPLDNATDPNIMLVADYTDGRDPMDIRWSIFQFYQGVPACIGMASFGGWSSLAPNTYTLKFGYLTGTSLYHLDPSKTTDDGFRIYAYYDTAKFGGGSVMFWKGLTFRANGTGNLSMYIAGEDDVMNATLNPIALSQTSGKELTRLLPKDFVNEKMSVRISNGANAGDNFNVIRMDVWSIPIWNVRPQ